MALYYDLTVYRDTYKLILKFFEYSKDFPKDYKLYPGAGYEARYAATGEEYIYRANKATHKKEHLEAFLDAFELISVI